MSRIMELKSMYNQKSTDMTKEEVQAFVEKLFQWAEKREDGNKYADDLMLNLIESQKTEIDELRDRLSTIWYSRKVKVPRWFADWIDKNMVEHLGDIETMLNCLWHFYTKSWECEQYGINEDQRFGWLYDNKIEASLAIITGEYEIEKDPKYYVVNSKGKYFCNMGFSTNKNKISNVIWHRDGKFEFKTKEAAEAVILLVGGKVEEYNA